MKKAQPVELTVSNCVVGEDSRELGLQGDQTSQS